MKISPTYLIILTLPFVLPSCNKPSGCGDCEYYSIPDTLGMEVSVTIDVNHPFVPVAVYEGNFEDGYLLFRDTLYIEKVTYYLPSNDDYSVTAKYERNGVVVEAIDGLDLDYQKVDDCDYECWAAKDNRLNLELKD